VLAIALAVRLVYLVIGGNSCDGLARAGADGPQLAALREALRFYSALGRGQLPTYYAHNPFWAPLYLVLFVLLTVEVATGLALEFPFLLRVAQADEPAVLALHARLMGWIGSGARFTSGPRSCTIGAGRDRTPRP